MPDLAKKFAVETFVDFAVKSAFNNDSLVSSLLVTNQLKRNDRKKFN